MVTAFQSVGNLFRRHGGLLLQVILIFLSPTSTMSDSIVLSWKQSESEARPNNSDSDWMDSCSLHSERFTGIWGTLSPLAQYSTSAQVS